MTKSDKLSHFVGLQQVLAVKIRRMSPAMLCCTKLDNIVVVGNTSDHIHACVNL